MRFIIVVLLFFFMMPAASAESVKPPLPQKKSEAIGSFDERIKDGKKKASSLQKKVGEVETDLAGMQKKLVSLADSMRKNEKELSVLDREISSLETAQDSLREALDKDRGEMADLILALQRIRRMPPEALIAKPDSPLKTAQSAMLLENTLPSLYKKAETLKVNLKKNDELARSLKSKREKVARASNVLKKEHRELSGLVQKREKLLRSTQSDIAQQEKQTQKIAAQAKNLKDLVQNLDEQRRRKATQNSAKKAATFTKRSIPKPGQARLPISGVIKTRFNDPDNFGAASKGIDIEGRGGALVVAPMGGVVRYAGAFKNYGRMVVIEHKGGYHSLIGGLDKVDALPGQSVAAGEPLGLLHYADSQAEKPVLYYELRYNGKAVNPARKFSDLS